MPFSSQQWFVGSLSKSTIVRVSNMKCNIKWLKTLNSVKESGNIYIIYTYNIVLVHWVYIFNKRIYVIQLSIWFARLVYTHYKDV